VSSELLDNICCCLATIFNIIYQGLSKSSRPDVVLFRIKLKFYLLFIARLRTLHAQYDFWAINISCIWTVVSYLQSKSKKNGVMQCNERQFWPICSLHCMFCCSDSQSGASWFLNNEFWDKFLLGHVGIVREVLQKLVQSSVSVLDTIWKTLKCTKYL